MQVYRSIYIYIYIYFSRWIENYKVSRSAVAAALHGSERHRVQPWRHGVEKEKKKRHEDSKKISEWLPPA